MLGNNLTISFEDLSKHLYVMFRDIEDGKYRDIQPGWWGANGLSLVNLKAMHDLLDKLAVQCLDK